MRAGAWADYVRSEFTAEEISSVRKNCKCGVCGGSWCDYYTPDYAALCLVSKLRENRIRHFYDALGPFPSLPVSQNGARALARMKARGVEFEDHRGFFCTDGEGKPLL